MQLKRTRVLLAAIAFACISICAFPLGAFADDQAALIAGDTVVGDNAAGSVSAGDGSSSAENVAGTGGSLLQGDPVIQPTDPYEGAGVRYRVKMKGSSWEDWESDYAIAGNASKADSTPIQNFALSLEGGLDLDEVYYQTSLTSGKLRAVKSDGEAVGNSSNVQALRVYLAGDIAERYSVMYRVYVQGVGWLKRTYDGDWAGTFGRKLRVQAVQVKLVERDERAGWISDENSWRYYRDGEPVKSQWIKSKESPIEDTQVKQQYYWIDSSGKLAVGRVVNPKKGKDKAAGYRAYATANGYVMRSESAWVGGWYTATSKGKLYVSQNARIRCIGRYVRWAMKIANDDSHGYSQAVRWGPDYDCSSFVISAVRAAGLKTGGAYWTGDMRQELCNHGFKWHTDLSKIKAGDILLVHNASRQHTELYIGNGKTVGAHIAETGGIYGALGDQTGKEISVAENSVSWQGYLRYKR